jgi:cyclopropane fatty-acyl-phospholipid synthase-like methyltransferase
MTRMNQAGFESRYRADRDPWGYENSDYERAKYEQTLAACGPGPFRCALELGTSIGVFSAMLAPRCGELVTIDCAPTAVAAARARLARHPQARVVLGTLPADLPVGSYDLVVASEILYYLSVGELPRLLVRLRRSMTTGARLVAVHWLPGGPERPLDARRVHAALRGRSWLTTIDSRANDDYLLDVLERR